MGFICGVTKGYSCEIPQNVKFYEKLKNKADILGLNNVVESCDQMIKVLESN
jgi:hypothetical protein